MAHNLKKNIKKLFQDRRLGVAKELKKRRKQAKENLPALVSVPKYSLQDTLGRTIAKFDKYSNRPRELVSSPQEPRPRKFVQPSFLLQAKSSTTSVTSNVWPPPQDLNYRQDSVQNLSKEADTATKSVDCDRCGKRGFSSTKQLSIHHNSKKCLNRQLNKFIHQCRVCNRRFDTPHNLDNHKCCKI